MALPFRDLNDNVRYIRDYQPYQPPAIEPSDSNTSGIIGGACIAIAFLLIGVALVVAGM